MKKNIGLLLVAVCLGFSLPAQAQLKWGVKGGVNLAKVSFEKSDLKTDNMNGYFIGPMAEFTLPVLGLGVDAALLYSQKGLKSSDNKYKEAGFDIPVNLKYNIGLGSLLGVFLAVGPNFYFDFKDNKDGVEKQRAMVGINVGGGVKLIKHLQLGFNYNIPLGKSGVTPGTVVDAFLSKSDYKMKTWQISAAYLF